MSEDLAFKIQLGIILPKMKEKIADDLKTIIDELVDILKQGTINGEELSIEPIKEIIMKDLDIFLDQYIVPGILEKIKPEVEESAEEETEEAETEA